MRVVRTQSGCISLPIQFGFDSHLLSMMSQVTVSGCISRCAHPIWIRQPAAVYDVTSNSVSMGAPNKKLLCIHTPDTLSSHTPDTNKNSSTHPALSRARPSPVPRSSPKVRSQGQIPRSGPKVKSQGQVPRSSPKVKSQGQVPRSSLRVKCQGQVPRSSPKVKSV